MSRGHRAAKDQAMLQSGSSRIAGSTGGSLPRSDGTGQIDPCSASTLRRGSQRRTLLDNSLRLGSVEGGSNCCKREAKFEQVFPSRELGVPIAVLWLGFRRVEHLNSQRRFAGATDAV